MHAGAKLIQIEPGWFGGSLCSTRDKSVYETPLCSLISPKCVRLGSDSVKNECTFVYIKHA